MFFKSLEKKNAAALLKDSEARDARQGSETIYQRLLLKGFTADEITSELAKAQDYDQRRIYLTGFEDDFGSDPVIGIAYTGDYRSEEEYGMSAISKNLKKRERQSELVTVVETGSHKGFAIFEDFNFSKNLEQNAETAVKRHTNPYMDTGDAYRYTVAQLRDKLKGFISPIPRDRARLERHYAEHILGKSRPKSVSVGEFHHGGTLVMMTDSPILNATLEMLFEAAVSANTLSIGTSRNPFSRLTFFYDDRDVSSKETAVRAAEKKWYDDRMEEAADAVSALRAAGSLYAIKPSHLKSVVSRNDLPEGDYYFINYYPKSSSEEGVFGWFKLEELFMVASGELTREMIETK
jgi:hypothetical protein